MDLQESQENQGKMERTENLVLKVYKAYLDRWGPLETKVPWVNRVEKVTLVCLDNRDPEEILARMALQAAQDHQDQWDQQEREEQQAVQDPVVSRECQDLQAKMDHLAKMGLQVCRDHLA